VTPGLHCPIPLQARAYSHTHTCKRIVYRRVETYTFLLHAKQCGVPTVGLIWGAVCSETAPVHIQEIPGAPRTRGQTQRHRHKLRHRHRHWFRHTQAHASSPCMVGAQGTSGGLQRAIQYPSVCVFESCPKVFVNWSVCIKSKGCQWIP